MAKLILCLILCLPLVVSAQAKKKVKVKAVARTTAATEEKIVYNPTFEYACPTPSITRGKVVLTASRFPGYDGKQRIAHEVVLEVISEGGRKKGVVISNENYAVNNAGKRVGEKWPVKEAYLLKCLRGFPEEVRTLIAGRELELLIAAPQQQKSERSP